MDDIHAKRNARRRRILENSESRLSKITGRDNNSEPEAQRVHASLSNQTSIATDIPKEPIHSNINGKIAGIDRTSSQIDHSSPELLTNRTNYIFLAIIVNILLILHLDNFFGKAVTIPYLPMMLGRLYNYRTKREMQESNLLYAALILCNIKPELTYQFKKLITLIYMILGDLALYIFSFTLIHYGLFYCLRNTDTLTTSDS